MKPMEPLPACSRLALMRESMAANTGELAEVPYTVLMVPATTTCGRMGGWVGQWVFYTGGSMNEVDGWMDEWMGE